MTQLNAMKPKGAAEFAPSAVPARAFNWIGVLFKADAEVMKEVVDVASQGKYIHRGLEYRSAGYAVPILAALDDYPNHSTQYRKSDEVLMKITEAMAMAGWDSQ